MGSLPRAERLALVPVALLAALAGVSNYAPFAATPRVLIATAALVGLAWMVSLGTEQVGFHFGPALTGLIQSTLGNLPELFVVIFALNAGELAVAQTAVVGSVLANALIVLGLVIVVGAWRAPGGVMRFSARLPNDTATLLLVATFIIVLLGISLSAHLPAGHHVEAVSVVGAVGLLVVYLAWLVPHLRRPELPEVVAGAAHIPLRTAVALLVLAGVGSAFVSDWFVASLRPAISTLSLSRPFVGIVVVAIAGNAVEHGAAITLAAKGRNELAISVVKSSVAQVAAFLYPALVLISLLLHTHLTFALAPLYIGALTLTTLAVRQITGDGEATLYEGVALITLYVVLAVVVALN
ncbi:MAG: sodium:proton exchanger [Acidobacteriota bacterium]|nr:sodium:proton exchanger [Acidobacteriota bacterium]